MPERSKSATEKEQKCQIFKSKNNLAKFQKQKLFYIADTSVQAAISSLDQPSTTRLSMVGYISAIKSQKLTVMYGT